MTILTKVLNKHSSGWECGSITLQMTDVLILAVCNKACILMLPSWFKSIKVVLWNKICMNHNVIVGYARCWGQMHFICSHIGFFPLKLNSLFHTTSFFYLSSWIHHLSWLCGNEAEHWGKTLEKSAQVASLTAASGGRLALLLPVTVILSPLKYSSPRKTSLADDIHYNFAGQLLTNTAERHWVIHSDKWSVVNISRRRKEFYFN